jgi:hypothetical protein
MSLKTQLMLAITLLTVILVVDVTAKITFGVCYVGGREIEHTGKPGDTVWVEQAMVHTFIPETITGDPVGSPCISTGYQTIIMTERR